MLSKRIIASLIIKDGTVVQSIGFSQYLPIGSPEIAVEFLNSWGADEILVLDIGENRTKRSPNLALVSALSKRSRVPLTVGGGIDNVETMRQLIKGGADKFVINRMAVERPEIITEAAAIFGNQCIVVSIDVRKTKDGRYEAFIDSGIGATGKDPVAVARERARLGAGEILIRSIDRDGSKKGFDIDLVRSIVEAVDVPVIAAGGCGHPQHVLDVFQKGKADAAAVGNMLHFSEHSVNTLKAYLAHHLPVRLDTYASYRHFGFDEHGRPLKRPDAELEKLRLEYHPKEVI
ncbi:hypothetical protein A2635_05590 [Candidatus Peribacteria bacterium RIFCSPHIGHO2_01_FULL_51_9]|nr:MAG: hypothetical protein A2635_05590 [Candidatus Peribacteria bacterium RIFCSPHIGHO2_01_FULL_51_9]